jgi:hypothetical protein
VVIALYIFGDALGWFKFSSTVKIEGTWLGDPSNQTILLVLFAFIAVVWFIVGGKEAVENQPQWRILVASLNGYLR